MPFLQQAPKVYYEYTKSPKRDAKTIVFICPFLTPCDYWAKWVPVFSAAYNCITFDVRGHGKTQCEHGKQWSYWDITDDIVSILDALSLEKAILIGTSQGGFIATRAALRYPCRVEAIVCMSTSARKYTGDMLETYSQMLEDVKKRGMKAAIEAIGDSHLQYSVENHPMVGQYKAWVAQCPEADLVLDFRALAEHDSVLEDLHRITCPTLVVVASQDEAFTNQEGDEMAAVIPNAECVHIDGGHSLADSRFDETTAVISKFLEAL